MPELIRLSHGRTLHDAFSVSVCGRNPKHGKPDPEIFVLAADELQIKPEHCFVAEDAPSGIHRARAGGMAPRGVARLHDEAGLHAAEAGLVVISLDDHPLDVIAGALLRRMAA